MKVRTITKLDLIKDIPFSLVLQGQSVLMKKFFLCRGQSASDSDLR